jgi:hypothetical protein
MKFWARVPHNKSRKKMSILTCVRKHLISELSLRGCIYNNCSKCPPWDSMRTSTRLIMDSRIHAKMSRQLRIVWQASIVRWWSACSLSTGAAFRCPHRYKSRGFKSGVGRGGHAVGPPVPVPRSRQVLLRTSRTARLKCAGAPSCMYHIGALLPVVQLPVALTDHVRGNIGSVYL